jgi:hypothetical protein
MVYLAYDLDDIFRSQLASFFNQFWTTFRTIDDLCFSVAIPQVKKNGSPMVASTVDPATKSYFLIKMFNTDFAAGMCSKQNGNPW